MDCYPLVVRLEDFRKRFEVQDYADRNTSQEAEMRRPERIIAEKFEALSASSGLVSWRDRVASLVCYATTYVETNQAQESEEDSRKLSRCGSFEDFDPGRSPSAALNGRKSGRHKQNPNLLLASESSPATWAHRTWTQRIEPHANKSTFANEQAGIGAQFYRVAIRKGFIKTRRKN